MHGNSQTASISYSPCYKCLVWPWRSSQHDPRTSRSLCRGRNQTHPHRCRIFRETIGRIRRRFFVGKTSCRRTSQRSVATIIFRKRNIMFPPHPFQELSYDNYLNQFISSQTDSRRTPQGALLLSQAAERHQDPSR